MTSFNRDRYHLSEKLTDIERLYLAYFSDREHIGQEGAERFLTASIEELAAESDRTVEDIQVEFNQFKLDTEGVAA
jgi:hypothetical protein